MIDKMESIAMNAWPSLKNFIYDGWILRFANGYTKRANSIYPIFKSIDPSLSLKRKIYKCEQLYASFNLNTIFKMTEKVFPINLDAILKTQGYKKIDKTSVQVLPLSRMDKLEKIDLNPKNIKIFYDVDDKWFESYCLLSKISEENKITLLSILANIIPKKIFISIKIKNTLIACGLGVLQDGYFGIFMVNVDEKYRRKGFGKQIVLNLLKEGKNFGAKVSYLQVMQKNIPAMELYKNLGYNEIYKYWYRIKKDIINENVLGFGELNK